MACPFFLPLRRVDEADRWVHAPRLPLGDFYRGVCRARPGEVVDPDESVQRELCNCGYARGRCERFPLDAAADAVRFSVTGESGDVVRIVYILERDHAPLDHGAMEYRVAEGAFASVDASELLLAQARAFVESYLRRRGAV